MFERLRLMAKAARETAAVSAKVSRTHGTEQFETHCRSFAVRYRSRIFMASRINSTTTRFPALVLIIRLYNARVGQSAPK